MNNGNGVATTRVALKHVIQGIAVPKLQALINSGQLGPPPALAGLGGVLLVRTANGALGLTFFDSSANAAAAQDAARAWWEGKLTALDSPVVIDAGTVLNTTSVVDPDARMVWTPGPQLV